MAYIEYRLSMDMTGSLPRTTAWGDGSAASSGWVSASADDI